MAFSPFFPVKLGKKDVFGWCHATNNCCASTKKASPRRFVSIACETLAPWSHACTYDCNLSARRAPSGHSTEKVHGDMVAGLGVVFLSNLKTPRRRLTWMRCELPRRGATRPRGSEFHGSSCSVGPSRAGMMKPHGPLAGKLFLGRLSSHRAGADHGQGGKFWGSRRSALELLHLTTPRFCFCCRHHRRLVQVAEQVCT